MPSLYLKHQLEGWYYLAVKKLSTSFHGKISKDKDNFYCFKCLHFIRTEIKLKFHEKVCKNKDFCAIIMPSVKNNILEVKHCLH